MHVGQTELAAYFPDSHGTAATIACWRVRGIMVLSVGTCPAKANLASTNRERQRVAARCVGDLVGKLGSAARISVPLAVLKWQQGRCHVPSTATHGTGNPELSSTWWYRNMS